ncbi:hypothetical protein Ahy_A03g012072 [Arachis hypogaea]|uniref:Uncharacterized protein n=1 Tax=Arachis hypogaea TaxID=3818 RepID=A0A445DSG8_ARAHY|nr:hypothetical protein Ahy_A03g012072 [Arachis hypogaea]
MLASSSWVSQKIVTNISRGEEMKIATVIQTIQDKYMANILVTKAYWVRKKARKKIHVFQKIMSALEHKLCLRYLYVIYKKAYDGGTVLKDLILSVAKVIFIEE